MSTMSPTLKQMLVVFLLSLFGLDSGLLELVQVGGQMDHTLLAEIPREGILFREQSVISTSKIKSRIPRPRLSRCNTYASACTKTSGVTHLD